MPIGLIIVLVIMVLGGIAITVLGNKPKKRGHSTKYDRIFLIIYARLYKFPLSGDKLRKITSQIQSLSIYGKRQAYVRASKYYLTSTAVMLAVIIAAVFIFKDAISVLICIAFAVVLSTVIVDKKVDKINEIVYKQLRITVSSLLQAYMRLNSVVEAVQESEVGYELRGCMEDILNIMTVANGELKLQEFFQKTPFRPMQTLARMCYNVNNIGDDKDIYGQSNFVQALTLMMTDINSELERIDYQKKRFGIIEYLPLVPILGIKLVESYFISIMPGTALIYQGVMGYIIRVVILVSGIMCYTIISKINNIVSIKIDDRCDWAMKLLDNKHFYHFIVGLAPKNAKRRKLNLKIKNCISKKTVNQLYTEKLVYWLVAFIVTILTLITTTQMGRDYILNSTQQLSLVATDEMQGYTHEQVLDMDHVYIGMCIQNGGQPLNEAESLELVGSYMNGLTDLQKLDQVKRMKDKYNSVVNSYFKWYYIIVAFGISCLAYMGPNLMLKLRRFLVNTEAEEDFLQLQTLMTIIMNTDCDTLDALEQLTDLSRIHRDQLLYCYHSFPSNPEMELARLESKTPILAFKRFVGKLKLTINDLSMAEAFSDLLIEREHILKLRTATMYNSINKKRTFCGLISLAPLGLFVIGELLIPIGYLGGMEFMNALSSLD